MLMKIDQTSYSVRMYQRFTDVGGHIICVINIMPCALTSNFEYPDYLKSILKEIDAGNDENLKACACSLKTPTTDEGCPILDEDDKAGLFPFCVRDAEEGETGEGTSYPLKLTLKQTMELYWKIKAWEIQYGHSVCRPYATINFKRVGEYDGREDPKFQKDLVCWEPSGPIGGDFFPSRKFSYITCYNTEGDVYFDQVPFSIFNSGYPVPDAPVIKVKDGESYYFYPKIDFSSNCGGTSIANSVASYGGNFAHDAVLKTFGTFKVYENGFSPCPPDSPVVPDFLSLIIEPKEIWD